MGNLPRLLENRGQTPALLLGDRTGLDDPHAVADAGHLGLVVHLELVRVAHDLLVQRVGLLLLHQDHHRLVHAVADDDALAGLATAALSALLAHASAPCWATRVACS